MNERLSSLIDEILRFTWSEGPTTATSVGIHDHDERLVDCSHDALEQRRRSMGKYRTELQRLAARPAELTSEESLDARVLLGALEIEERLLEEVRPAYRDPAYYLDEILYGVYYLAEREFAPLPDRVETAARRLTEVPRLLRQAQSNLSDPLAIPMEWVEAALQQIRGSLSFLRHLALNLGTQAGSSGAAFEKACAVAVQSLKEFETYLRGALAGTARGSIAIGKPLFELMLRAQHGIEPDAGALEAFGRRLVEDTLARLTEEARTIDARRPWQELVSEWKNDHPAEEDLVEESAPLDR